MATGDFVIRDIRHLRWSGSNGALIAQMCNEIEVDDAVWTVQSEIAGSALVLMQYQSAKINGTWTVPAGRPNVLVSNDFAGLWAVLADTNFANRYNKWLVMLQEAIDAGQVLLPSYTLVTSSGQLALPALLLGATFTAVVPLRNAMPTTGYNVTWRATAGAAVLSSLQLQAGKSITKTTTAVTIPLQATGVASIAGLATVEVSALVAS